MLTKEFRESHPDIEWDAIEGMRHVLVHGYSRTVWSTKKASLCGAFLLYLQLN